MIVAAEPTSENPEIAIVAEHAFAKIYGQPMSEMPKDLYIPPEALEIFLDAFEGPLDLLLYLIRKHNLDILDIPMADLTRQYMVYVELLRTSQLELAAEYLVMAAILTQIKSRMLLPRPPRFHQHDQEGKDVPIIRLELISPRIFLLSTVWMKTIGCPGEAGSCTRAPQC